MLKLLLGRAGSGKTETLLRTMAERGPERPQLLIVPEQHSHDMERRLCEVGGSGSANTQRCSPSPGWPIGSFPSAAGWREPARIRRAAAAHVRRAQGGGRPPEGLWAPLPQARNSFRD